MPPPQGTAPTYQRKRAITREVRPGFQHQGHPPPPHAPGHPPPPDADQQGPKTSQGPTAHAREVLVSWKHRGPKQRQGGQTGPRLRGNGGRTATYRLPSIKAHPTHTHTHTQVPTTCNHGTDVRTHHVLIDCTSRQLPRPGRDARKFNYYEDADRRRRPRSESGLPGGAAGCRNIPGRTIPRDPIDAFPIVQPRPARAGGASPGGQRR